MTGEIKPHKKHDLTSVMKLLKEFDVPNDMQPMQNIVYSTVQMFAATWLANTQQLVKQSDDYRQLEAKLNLLQQSQERERTTTSNSKSTPTAKSSVTFADGNNDTSTLQKIQEQQELILQRLSKVEDDVQRINISEKEKENNHNAANNADNTEITPEVSNKLTADVEQLQAVFHVHGKKISELIKRYKRDHAELGKMRTKVKVMDDRMENMKHESETLSKQGQATDDEASDHEVHPGKDFKEDMKKLENTLSTKMEQIKLDLSGHEAEHEGIINELIHQLENMKTVLESVSAEVAENRNNAEYTSEPVMDEQLIDRLLSKKTKSVQSDLEKVVQTKTKKIENMMEMLLTNMSELNNRYDDETSTSQTKFIGVRPLHAKSRRPHSSKRTNEVDVLLQSDQIANASGADVETFSATTLSKVGDGVGVLNSLPMSSKRHNRRRVRSTSFEHYGKQSSRSRLRSSSGLLGKRPDTRGKHL